MGFSELLKHETDGTTQEGAEHIYNSSVKLLGLLNDLLDMSKLEAGRIDIADEVFQIERLIEDVLRSFTIVAKNKGLQLLHTIDPSIICDLRGDAIHIRQVLLNLLQNAIKFTDAGTIRLDVMVQKRHESQIFVLFSVQDTGVGIAAEDQKKLFKLFVQVDGSTTRRHGGTGLGLTISKRLVELMGGAIGVDSTKSGGSTFWFVLPFRECTA